MPCSVGIHCRLVLDDCHVKHRVPKRVPCVGVSPLSKEVVIDGLVAQTGSKCQWVFSIIRVSYDDRNVGAVYSMAAKMLELCTNTAEKLSCEL